jgi:drug/metabolite transporter (DMT)-like permease
LRSARLTGLALSGTGAMLFAIKGILIKLIYRYGIDTTTLLAIRMLLCVPVFAGVGAIEWRRRPPGRRPDARTIALAAGTGILGYYVSSWLDFEGLQTIDAQIERLILFTYPFLVILLGRLLFGHPLRLHAVIGAALSYAGLVVMFAGDPGRMAPAMLVGAGLVLAAAMTFAFYQIFARELIVRCGAALFTAIAMAAAGAVMIGHFLLTHPIAALALPASVWPLVIGLAVFATIVPAFMMSAGTARIGAQGTAIVSTLSPLVTIALAVVILDESFGVPEALGTLSVLAGVGWFSLVESRRAAA